MSAEDFAAVLREEQVRCQHESPARYGGIEYSLTVVAPILARLEARIAEKADHAEQFYAAFLEAQGRAEAAEARCEALTAALREIADYGHEADDYEAPPSWTRRIARAALATSEQARTEEGAE